MKKVLFLIFFSICACTDGYSQFWRGAIIEGLREAKEETIKANGSSNSVGIVSSQIRRSDAISENILKLLRERVCHMRLLDSVFTIAKSDTFRIICKTISWDQEMETMELSDVKYINCIGYLIFHLRRRDKVSEAFLASGAPSEVVADLYRIMIRMDGKRVQKKKQSLDPPEGIARKELKLISPWVSSPYWRNFWKDIR